MDERVEYPMTDNQWNGIIKMVITIMFKCKTLEEAIRALMNLLRNEDATELLKQLEEDSDRQ